MLSMGRCGVARLQMKVGHIDGMHCFIDSTSILVKIKSVTLYLSDCVQGAATHATVSVYVLDAHIKQLSKRPNSIKRPAKSHL